MRVSIVALLFATAGAVLAPEALARADEAVPVDRFATIREQIVQGKLADARASLAVPMETPADRAVAAELQFVLDTWIAAGGVPRHEPGTAAAPPAEWEAGLADARDLLLRGSFAAAAFRLRTLADSAPNDVRRAVASELGRVAGAMAGRTNETPPAPKALPLTVVAKEKPETETRWYGWQTLLLDAGSIGITLLTAPTQSPAPAVIGGVGYVLAPPILHAFHDRAWITLLDIGLRIALPIVGGVIGNATCNPNGSDAFFPCAGNVAAGVLVGMGLAIVLDAAALSYESVPVKKSAGIRVMPSGLRW